MRSAQPQSAALKAAGRPLLNVVDPFRAPHSLDWYHGSFRGPASVQVFINSLVRLTEESVNPRIYSVAHGGGRIWSAIGVSQRKMPAAEMLDFLSASAIALVEGGGAGASFAQRYQHGASDRVLFNNFVHQDLGSARGAAFEVLLTLPEVKNV